MKTAFALLAICATGVVMTLAAAFLVPPGPSRLEVTYLNGGRVLVYEYPTPDACWAAKIAKDIEKQRAEFRKDQNKRKFLEFDQFEQAIVDRTAGRDAKLLPLKEPEEPRFGMLNTKSYADPNHPAFYIRWKC